MKKFRLLSLLLIVVLCVGMLTACGMNSYQKKLEDAGYTVEVVSQEELEETNAMYEQMGIDITIKGGLSAVKDLTSYVSIIQLGSKSEAEDLAASFKLIGMDYVIDGSYLITGDEEGLKLFK